ncbi:mycothiol system anti-sigma-R factor [Rothia sp. LK2588]|uniref:mycothiol system anti-sigma-R factor n=1 Tax=Rothia sp. LK2588 TaxID=3114369 RepID=UPI0034CFC03D
MTWDDTTENPCNQKLGSIYEYLDGALSCEDLKELNEHLASCDHCAREYDLEKVIRGLMKRCCCETAPQDLKAKIRQRIDEIKNAEHPAAS